MMLDGSSRVVIVGAGIGGLRSAEQLRARGYEGGIVVVGDEEHLPYNRPPLSKAALRQELDHSKLAFRQRLAAEDVQWCLGTTARAVDVAGGRVTLETGEALLFDALIAATGMTPRRVPIAGAGTARHVVRTLDDAVGLRAQLAGERAGVVVIGTGFIGCEVAATAREMGAAVDVVGRGDVPLATAVGPMVGGEVRRRHEAKGIRYHLGRQVTGIEESATGSAVVSLDDGSELGCDVIVEAIGSAPNVAWLHGNGFDLSDGVLTDGWLDPRPLHQRVGPQRVAVVGDIARFPNPLFDEVPRRIEHWSMPAETAKRAAVALVTDHEGVDRASSDRRAGAPPFVPVPAFWSDQFGVRIQSFGLPHLGAGDVRLLEGDLGGDFAVGYYRDEVIIGVVLAGLLSRHGHYRRMVAERQLTPVLE